MNSSHFVGMASLPFELFQNFVEKAEIEILARRNFFFVVAEFQLRRQTHSFDGGHR